jgi:hypothetical protein
MPRIVVMRARVGTIVPRPKLRQAKLKGEKRGTWVVILMDHEERATQELTYPHVRQHIWLGQVYGD